MIQRRGFLGAILAAGIAPAFVRAGVLMPVKEIWVPPVVDVKLIRRVVADLKTGLVDYEGWIRVPGYERFDGRPHVAWNGTALVERHA